MAPSNFYNTNLQTENTFGKKGNAAQITSLTNIER